MIKITISYSLSLVYQARRSLSEIRFSMNVQNKLKLNININNSLGVDEIIKSNDNLLNQTERKDNLKMSRNARNFPNSKSVEGSNDYGLTFEQTPLAEINFSFICNPIKQENCNINKNSWRYKHLE